MLNLTLTVYALNGSYLGQQDVTTELQLCSGDFRQLRRYQRIGTNYLLTCRLDLAAVALGYSEPLFYELWLADPVASDGSSRPSGPALYPVPVIISNYRKSDGTTPNRVLVDRPFLQLDPSFDALGTIVPHRRFFLYDNIGGGKIPDPAKAYAGQTPQLQDLAVIRWASYIELRIQLQKDNPSTPIDESLRMYPPYLLIQYKQQVGTTIPIAMPRPGEKDESMRFPMVTFRVTYCMDLSGYWYVTMILFILLIIAIVIRFGSQVFTQSQARGTSPLQWDSIFADACGTLADFFFWGLIVMCGYWFIFFKLQGVIKVLLPIENPNTNFLAIFSVCLVAKCFQENAHTLVAVLIYKQCKVDVFFIDWEKPADGDIREAVKGPRDADVDLPNVSMWRTIMIANEWAEIQSERHTDIDLTLMFTLLFLAGLDYTYLATPQPDVTDLSPGPTNAALRFFAIAMWYFTVVAIQLIYCRLSYHFLDDPLDTFVDVCQLANVSVFLLDGPIHGFYLHGRSVHARTDVNMRTMLANHKAETEGNLPFRGLTRLGEAALNGATDLFFEMFLTDTIRVEFDERFGQMKPGSPAAGRRTRNSDFAAGGGGLLPANQASDANAHANHAVNQFLQREIEDIEGRPADIRNPTWTQRLFGTPPAFVGVKSMFVRDNQKRFARTLFYGMEGDLAVLDFLMLAAWDLASGDVFVAALLTYLGSHGLCFIRDYLGKENIAKKTLIDRRFLI